MDDETFKKLLIEALLGASHEKPKLTMSEEQARTVLDNLLKGSEISAPKHMQGFPDNVRDRSLRGIFRLIKKDLTNVHTDPSYKAAAILCLVSVAGGLITIESGRYRCNNGFIDSWGEWHSASTPVKDNLRIMAKQYVSEPYFVNKAFGFLYDRDDVDLWKKPEPYDPDGAAERIRTFYSLAADEAAKADRSKPSAIRLQYLKTLIETLAKPEISCADSPAALSWDADAWLT